MLETTHWHDTSIRLPDELGEVRIVPRELPFPLLSKHPGTVACILLDYFLKRLSAVFAIPQHLAARACDGRQMLETTRGIKYARKQVYGGRMVNDAIAILEMTTF